MEHERKAVAPEVESRWTTAAGFRIHYRYGRNRSKRQPIPVVLVHGLVVSSRYMVPLAVRLAAEHDVYAPDLPGYGLSEKPDDTPDAGQLAEVLVAWLDSLGLRRVAVLAHSYGCQIVTELAVRHPERAERLVFVGPTVDPQGRTAWQQLARWALELPRERPSYKPIMARDFFDAGLLRAVQTLRHSLNHHIEDRLPHVRVPTLVVRGTRDPIVPQRWAEEAAQLLPAGRLKVIPGGAHALNHDTPLELTRVIRPFLRDLPPPHPTLDRQTLPRDA